MNELKILSKYVDSEDQTFFTEYFALIYKHKAVDDNVILSDEDLGTQTYQFRNLFLILSHTVVSKLKVMSYWSHVAK